MHYYNEFDPGAAAWLRNLINAGLLPFGVVDTRSITEVTPDDLRGYHQVHLFAGIGGWALAARLAGWHDERPLWTASFPCQPFSNAGLQRGTDDPRHLWPYGFRLVRACRPPVLMGEQVAGSLGYGWFDGVQLDLESEGYAARAVDIPACAIGAAHQRNRLYWCATAARGVDGMVNTACFGRGEGITEPIVRPGRSTVAGTDAPNAPASVFEVGTLADREGQHSGAGLREIRQVENGRVASNNDGFMGNAINPRLERHGGDGDIIGGSQQDRSITAPDGSEWVICHDGKARRTKPGIPMLVDGISGTVVVSHADQTRNVHRNTAWKGFGNAIHPSLAAEVIAAYLECYP